MKVLFLFGDSAVGKMTVGKELSKITQLKLFHNHMTIEPVIEVMGKYDACVTNELREVFFRNFAQTDNYGLIFTFIWNFDSIHDDEYVEWIKEIFLSYCDKDVEFYFVELDATFEVRLERNKTAQRLAEKPSKRDIQLSEQRLIRDYKTYRCVSEDGEIKEENFLRIENSNISAIKCAEIIKEKFSLE